MGSLVDCSVPWRFQTRMMRPRDGWTEEVAKNSPSPRHDTRGAPSSPNPLAGADMPVSNAVEYSANAAHRPPRRARAWRSP